MKPIKTLVLFLILLFIVMLCSGCLENNPMFEDSDSFLSFEEGDVYTCTINDDVNFWYSPIDMYGEWTNGETVVPIKMRDGNSGKPRVCSHYVVDFFDEYGCRIGSIVLCMSDNSLKMDTTANRSICLKLEKVEVLNGDYQEFLDDQFANLNWEGVVIRKEKKEVSLKASVFQPLEAWGNTGLDKVLTCDEGDFWFLLSSGKGYWKDNPAAEDVLCFMITPFTPYPPKWYDKELDIRGGYYSEPCVKLYMIDGSNNSVLKSYEIFADQEGYYILLESEEEPIKARLTKATSDADPRLDFLNFMQGEDESKNTFTFTCEQGGFSYTGHLGIGVWETEGEKFDIKVSRGEYPLEICISLISDELTGDIILKADFIEMTDENTAKFRIRSEFLGGKVFPDSQQAEFYVTKQAASE